MPAIGRAPIALVYFSPVAVRKFVVAVLLLFLASALVTAQQRSSESLSQQIKTLNLQFSAPVNDVEMRRRIRDRASLLAKLIEIDPSAAIASALPEETRAALAAAYPDEPVESSGTWEGEGRELVEDDFAHGVSRTRYSVVIDGQEVSAFFADQIPRFQCGRRVNVSGLRLGGRIAVTAVTSGPLLLSPCSTLGQQKTAVLIVSFPGVPNTVSQSVVQSAFFGSGRSLSNYWSEASYGVTSAAGGVFGPFVTRQNVSVYVADQPNADCGYQGCGFHRRLSELHSPVHLLSERSILRRTWLRWVPDQLLAVPR
jgi:hypothetical protein